MGHLSASNSGECSTFPAGSDPERSATIKITRKSRSHPRR